MLTLVALVLAHDIALDICDLRSSIVEAEDPPRVTVRLSAAASLKDRSWTRLEKDMVAVVRKVLEGAGLQLGNTVLVTDESAEEVGLVLCYLI